jgi:hypothetical protein
VARHVIFGSILGWLRAQEVDVTGSEIEALGLLRHAARDPQMHRFLSGAAHALRQVLAENARLNSAQAFIPLDLYQRALSADVLSCWVFVLRRNHKYGAERHPNSIQRMFALDGAGAMELWEHGHWRRHDFEAGRSDDGLSIPAQVWHRTAMLADVWAALVFHTAPAMELIDEVGDPAESQVFTTRARTHLRALR